MKIYIVKAPRGEYDDYQEPILGVFTDEEKADAIIEKRNAAIEENYRKEVNCKNCSHYLRKLPIGTTKVDGLPCWKAVNHAFSAVDIKPTFWYVQCEGNFVRSDDAPYECIKEEIELDKLMWEPDDLS